MERKGTDKKKIDAMVKEEVFFTGVRNYMADIDYKNEKGELIKKAKIPEHEIQFKN